MEPTNYIGGASFAPYNEFYVFAGDREWRQRLALNADCPASLKISIIKGVGRGVYYVQASYP